MALDPSTLSVQERENELREQIEQDFEKLHEEQQRYFEQQRIDTASDAMRESTEAALIANGATEEESLVPPDIDTEDLEAYAKHEGSFSPSSELNADEAREIEKFMVDLKKQIESKDAESLQMLMASETYPARDAIKTIYAKMFGESMEKAMQKNGLYPDTLKNSLGEKKERVFAIKQKVLDACFGLAA